MRSRTWFLLLIGTNLLLGAGWYFSAQQRKPETQITPLYLRGSSNARNTNVYNRYVLEPKITRWENIESRDYETYIANLKSIGCPEETIRDIIVADVNNLYTRRKNSEVISADHEWWRTEPDLDAVQRAIEKVQSLEQERKMLLTKLLGAGWEKSENPTPPAVRTGINLSGPVLGELPAATKEKVYNIAARTELRVQEYQEQMREAGRNPDPIEIAKIRQQTRTELASVLNPTQMEEYLLRYSRTAEVLRSELAGTDLTPDEFRALFRIRDPIELQSELQSTNLTRSPVRASIESQRDAAMRQILGPQRFQEYKLNQDPAFQLARSTAQRIGAAPETVMPLYRLTQATQVESSRIQNDRNLTTQQKAEALLQIQKDLQRSYEQVLGKEAFERFQETDEEISE